MIKTIVNDFLNYMHKRDLKNLINLFAEEVNWEIPGNTRDLKWLGIRKNKSEVESFFELLWKETEPISAEIHKVLFDKDEVILKGVFTTKMLRTDKIVTSIFFIHFKVYNGKIIEYILLEDTYAVSKSMEL
ncbi:MAG: nuclear transport factor 2 family protein [Sphingobacterium sp.]|uniref:nuclear transport factor 2 family protein n=1 Tax=Sphingobacterium sp. JB170 TaxID=1434842 RepID=UPI0015C6556B|nr:nuclear transport factor 2 family protein [Sphingobacterium sp. JB170]